MGSCLLLACAASTSAPQRDAAPERAGGQPPDGLSTLVAQLPPGADQCVLARPSRLPEQHRSLYARVSQAQPLAWLEGLPIDAYATVSREQRAGAAARVTLLLARGPAASVRSALQDRSGLVLSWEGEPCDAEPCPVRARELAGGVVRLEQGVFPTAARPGVERACAKLAVEQPAALEVSTQRTRSLALADAVLAAQQTVEVTADGVHVSREEVVGSELEGELLLQAGLLPAVSELATQVRRRRTETGVRTDFDVLFQDLVLAREDERRLADAERAAAQLGFDDSAPSAAAAGIEDVLAEVGHRLERAARLAGDERRAELTTVRAVLERALELDPDDERCALVLAELLLTELSLPDAALPLTERFVRKPEANARWRGLRRHAAALRNEAALAAVLAEDRAVPRARARAVAARIVELMREGTSFERAQELALAEQR